jgi:hypothetical protein
LPQLDSVNEKVGLDLGKKYAIRWTRVVDPYSFFPDPDPDPEYDVGGQYGSGSNTDPDPDPDPIRIQGFNDQKLKKNYR